MVTNEQKRGRVALFLIFGVCKISCRYGAILGRAGGGFLELFGGFWVDLEGLQKNQISSSKLKAEKVVPES